MHGEKLFMIREAFSHFSSFYVWDSFYIKLFLSLRADKTKYLVSPIIMPSIVVNKDKKNCVYYLGLESKKQLKAIKVNLEKLGIDYLVRPHPVYETPAVRHVFDEKHIEDVKSVDIWKSISNAGMVISIYSTVLFQAFLQGADIVIDDISNAKLFKDLQERDYIMFDKPHLLLSKIIKDWYESFVCYSIFI